MRSTHDVERLLLEEVAVILNAAPAAIAVERPLHELGMDSMSFVELLVAIEKKCAVNVIESGIAPKDFRTIRALASYVASLGAGKPAGKVRGVARRNST